MMDQVQGTVVHFVVNIGGGVWSVAKTLAAYHRPRWRVLLVAMYKGPLRPSHAADIERCFDDAHLIHRPSVTGIYYLAPANVASALAALGVDRDAENLVCLFHTGPYTPLVYRLPRKPQDGKWLTCFHGSRGNFHDVSNPAKRLLHMAGVRSMLKKDIMFVAVSHRSAKDCSQLYRCREDDFHVIHNGTSQQSVTVRASTPTLRQTFQIGFLGTVMPIKGWQKVVAAARQLRKEGFPVSCSILGDGPDFSKLQSLAEEHPDWLKAPGHVDAPQRDWLPELDVLILPSEFEGHPEVILEAMSCGVPCICSDVGGCAETVRNEREGYILRENTADEIADCIRRIMSTEGMWANMSRNCVLRHSQLFTAERMASNWEELFTRSETERGARTFR